MTDIFQQLIHDSHIPTALIHDSHILSAAAHQLAVGAFGLFELDLEAFAINLHAIHGADSALCRHGVVVRHKPEAPAQIFKKSECSKIISHTAHTHSEYSWRIQQNGWGLRIRCMGVEKKVYLLCCVPLSLKTVAERIVPKGAKH